ncbi:MAG TPA: DEAD/DEAH box helicase [Fibrobacteria bacterium]|nr:DEAD/DEAH box helicase [Fibrobacteria bacterium]
MNDPISASSSDEGGAQAQSTPYSGDASIRIVEPQPPLPDLTLDKLSPALQDVVRGNGWSDLMLVQKKAAPYILGAQDIIVQSKTGSGKTGAFLLPLLEVIEKSHAMPQLLIMTPTRELALQVHEEAKKFGEPLGIRSVAVYGGVAYGPQLDAFKAGVHIVVGTPGRLLDHIMNGNLSLKSVRDLVMDEADEMLGMGFYPDMKRIQSFLPKDRCTYLFSATMPVNVKRLANEFMRKPKFLSLCPTEVSVSSMEHVYYVVDPHDKDKALLQVIELENPESAIIFCNTRRDTAYVHEYLRARGLRVGAISGDVGQKERQQVMQDLKDGKIRFLVATDVAARGIDINGLSHVFMYDHPDDSEVYVHRSGRTARAGNSGQAISFVGLVEEMAIKNTAQKHGIPFIKKALPDEKHLGEVIRERASVYLEQAYRGLKQTDKKGADRMVPLLEDLIKSDDEKKVLGMLLHQFYWQAFTGNEAGEEAGSGTNDGAGQA